MEQADILEQELDDALDEISYLENQLESENMDNCYLHEYIQQLEDDITSANEENTCLTEEVMRLEANLTDCEDEINYLNDIIADLQHTVSLLLAGG